MFSRTRRISLIRYVNQLDKDYKFSSSTVISCRSGKPVPAGINLPIATFSFKPNKWSVLDAVAASVSTRVVSWKEAADIKLVVFNED